MPLRVESGRFIGEKFESRICVNCDSDCIEDETHFVFDCQLYQDLRRILFTDVKLVYPEFDNLDKGEKWNILMYKCVRKMASFIKRAYIKRKLEMSKLNVVT